MLASKRPFITTVRGEDGTVQLICSGCMAVWISFHPEDVAGKRAGEHVKICGLEKPNPALAAPRQETAT